MATVLYIPEHKQSPSAMRACIRYCVQEKKTVDADGRQYVGGVNCLGVHAYEEFMATKNLYRKASGVYFYQYVQSFRPGEIRSYEEAHRIGLEFAGQAFPGYEVLVATHLDAYDENGAQRVHNHFIVNSVSFEDGRKIHFTPNTLQELRQISDNLCRNHGLSVLPPSGRSNGKGIGTREYRATMKGDGWKFQLINDIDTAMSQAGSREEFCDLLTSAGYAVNWTDTRKYITFTCPNGQKVRDNKLHDNKYTKENLEHEFRIRKQLTDTDGQHSGSQPDGQAEIRIENNRADNRGNTVSTGGIRNPEGGLERLPGVDEAGSDLSADALREDLTADNQSGSESLHGRDVAGCGGLGRERDRGCEEIDRQHRPEGADTSESESGTARTGWEDAREVYLRSHMEGKETHRGVHRPAFGYEAVDCDGGHRDDLLFGTFQRSDMQPDTVKGFFRNERPEEPTDEEPDEPDIPTKRQMDGLWEQAELGNPYAAYRLSRILFDADSPYCNEADAAWYLELSAKKGYHMAQYRLGRMVLDGDYYDSDPQVAEYWLVLSARQENAYAETLLGKLYLTGDFLRPNRKAAVDLLYRAVNHGNAYAAYTLGCAYADGKYLKRDLSKAIPLLEQAAQMGNPFAEYRLAKVYLFESDWFDWQKAVEHLNSAAHRGNENAYRVLQNIRRNTVISITTGIADLLGDLTGLFDTRPPVQDCTTMAVRRERKKQDDEQRM